MRPKMLLFGILLSLLPACGANETTATPINVSALQTAAVQTVFAGASQTATAHVPTHTPQPTDTLTPTPTKTPLPFPLASCEGNLNFASQWQAEMNEMKFEAFLCPDNTLIAIFHNQEFEEFIKVNQGTANKVEYEWAVAIDTDSDISTGTSNTWFDGIVGAEYRLSISKFVYGQSKLVPFNEAFQKNVWNCTSGKTCGISSSDVEYVGDHANRFIVIRGKIPDINPHSKILFFRYRFGMSDRLTYKTDWIISSSVP